MAAGGIFIRKTRSKQYFQMPDGKIHDEDNSSDVTKHSFVISQAIEYSKKRKQHPKIPKRAQQNVEIPKKNDAICSARSKINAKSDRATRVYPLINLNLSAVPKPTKIRSKKQLGKPKSTVFYFNFRFFVSLILF